MTTVKRSRDPNLDVVRCIALLGVVSVHFFMHTNYYFRPVQGARMYVMTLLRTGAMTCVPLFLLLSGYLLRNKRPERGYYLSLVRTLGIYLLACGVSLLYRLRAMPQLTARELLQKFLNFNLPEYGWYIEMYLGLFLLIPWLNILFHALEGKRRKQQLLLTLLALTALPELVNIDSKLLLLPDWWVNLYPVTYYLLGSYLREYPIKCRPLTAFLGFGLLVLAAGSMNFGLSHGKNFVWGNWQDWGSALNLGMAVLLLTGVNGMDLSRMPGWLKVAFARISEWSLGAFLVSWIFDFTFYPILCARVADPHLRLNWMPVMVPAVYGCSLALSALLQMVYDLTLGRLLRKTQQRLR